MRYEVWTPELLVNGNDVTEYITSEITVSVQAGNARVLQFSCGLGTGGFDMQPMRDIGKGVIFKVNNQVVFTGEISNFNANLSTGVVHFDCSDSYSDSYAKMAKIFEEDTQLQAEWNKHLLGEKKTATAEEKYRTYLLQNDLIYSIAADGSDLLTHTTAAGAIAANTPVTAFNESNLLAGSGDVSFASNGKPINEIVYEIAFRYPVAHHIGLDIVWTDPYPYQGEAIPTYPAHYYLGGGVYFGTRAGFEGALNTLGYKIHSIDYTPVSSTRYDITPKEIQGLLMNAAIARVYHRFVTYQTEYRTLIIQNKNSIAAHGLNSDKRTIAVQALENVFDVNKWCEDINAPGPKLFGRGWKVQQLPNLLHFDPALYNGNSQVIDEELRDISNDNFSVDDAANLAIKMAKKELVQNMISPQGAKGGLATTTLRFKTSFFDLPSANVGWPATYSSSRWDASGIVNAMDLTFSLDGTATADIVLTSVTPPIATIPANINDVIPLDKRAEEQLLTVYNSSYIPNAATGLLESTLRPQDRIPRKAGEVTANPYDTPLTLPFNPLITLPTFTNYWNSWQDLGVPEGTPNEQLPTGCYLNSGGTSTINDIPVNLWIIRTPELPPPQDTIYIKAPEFFECDALTADTFISKF